MRLLLTGLIAIVALFAISIPLLFRTDVVDLLTEAQNAVGFPPGANNLEQGQIPDNVEGAQVISLPVRFQLPAGSDLETLRAFYRARCEALGATSYGSGLVSAVTGDPDAMCGFPIDDHEFRLDFALSCDDGCTGQQTVFLQN
ncbi:hypothetical protein AADZ90_017955 [Aestuariibius sp. 2305UL40-4]|uniref:hypothetical protein n=1 Tax=Aestuariibius violaceus TaxID=3234132 RepID=UPI00345E974B